MISLSPPTICNSASKSPYIGTGGDLALGVGNRDHYRFTADVNHAFNDDIAVRLNVMGDRADSRREPVNSRKWGVAPSIAFGLSGDTQFELSYKHDREDRVPDFGVPYLRTGSNTRTAATNAVDQFYGFHTDFEDIQRDAYTAKFRHRFNDRLRFDNTLRYSRTQYQMLGVPPRLTENADGTYTIARNLTGNGIKSTHYDAGTWTNHSNLNWLFDTGSVQHDVLFNLELTRERRRNYNDSYTFFDRATGVQVRAKPWENLRTLTPGTPADDVYYQRSTDYSGTLTTRTIGLGINDIISITPTFKAIAGVRYNHIKTENDAATGEQLSRSDGIWTYNGSLVWDYAPGHNLYATYSTAVTPVAYRVTGQSDSLDPTQLVADPEETRTFEIGSKNAFFEDALTVNAALFHTKKTQQYYRDAGFIDWAKVYGLDVEVAGRITPRWNIIGNLVWSNGSMRATSPSTVQLDGHFPEGAAKFTANVWTNYRITDTVNAGFGLRHVGDRYTHMPARGPNPVMVQKLPSYTVADAMVSYENRNYRVQLNVNNLFDKKHFTTGHRQQAIPGERRNVLLTLGYRF